MKNKKDKDIEKSKINEPKEKKVKKRIREKNKIPVLSIIIDVIMVGMIGVATLVLVFGLYIIITSPDFNKELLYSKESTVIYDKEGNELAKIGADNRTLVTYDDLSEVFVDALVATEDSRFFQHNGLDGARFIKATIGQLMGNSSAGGASTLSMQVAKNIYNGKESKGIGGIIRKFKDIYMAVFKIENSYTKEEIIEFYVNFQWFNKGNTNYASISGVEEACDYFFGKSVSDLNLAEASLLAGMFQNPYAYNPYKFPNAATKRREIVLKLVVRHGYITEEERKAAEAIPIKSLLSSHEEETASNIFQADIDFIVNDVKERTGHNPYSETMKIYSTIDPKIQEVLNKVELDEKKKLFPDDEIQEGIAITSMEDGSIVALSGGRNYVAKGLNRAVDIERMPGSSAKILFDYGPYIEFLDASTYTPLLDEETKYSNGTPIRNADRKYLGLMNMREALVRSRNIPALRAFQATAKNNREDIKNFVHSLGINYGDELYESAAIGGGFGVSPLQMSAAYAAFGRGGYYIEPYSFTKVELVETDETINYKYKQTKVMSEETAYMVTSMLVTAGDRGVGGKIQKDGVNIAAKTGTSTIDSKAAKLIGVPSSATQDAWNITFDPKYAIALWIGYDNTTSSYYLTSTKGGNIRRAVMQEVAPKVYTKKDGKFKKPSSVVRSEVEQGTFPPQKPSAYTPSDLIITELFKAGTEPNTVSNRFSKLNAPSNLTATKNNQTVTLTWSKIPTPDAISDAYLSEHFTTYYGDYNVKYYEDRKDYNAKHIGVLTYPVYLNSNGNLTQIGTVNDSSCSGGQCSFKYVAPSAGTYSFSVKSSYSIFKSNASNAITTTISVESVEPIVPIIPPVDDPVTPEIPETPEPTKPDDNIDIKPSENDF